MQRLSLIYCITILLCLCGVKSSPAFELEFPVSCQLNEDCWVKNSDKNGTDISIKSLKEMEKGVPVLAAEAGIVTLVREDSENKTFYGNSVVIEHIDGWKTIYNHLKNLNVKPGDSVKTGDKIAEIGISGVSEFPHLTFVLYKDGEFLSPSPLWEPSIREKLKVKDIVIADAGIDAENSVNNEIYNDTPSISIWIKGLNYRKGDFLKFSLNNPNGENILKENILVKEDYEEKTFKVDKLKGPETWQTGNYNVKIDFIRPEPGIAKQIILSFIIKEPPKKVDKEAQKKEEEAKKEEELKQMIQMDKRRRFFYLKKLYEEGKLPDTVPDSVKERLKEITKKQDG